MYVADKIGRNKYYQIHCWVRRNLGEPKCCSVCKITEAPKNKKNWFQWANISQEYNQDLADWERLCIPCHRRQFHLDTCKNGHKITSENNRVDKRDKLVCRACNRGYMRKLREKRFQNA